MRRLAAASARVQDGYGQVVLVTGPAGIGKTRLCEEGARLAQAAGFSVAWGRCWADGGAPGLWPWQPVLTELCGPDAAGLLDHDSGPDPVNPERFSRFLAVVDRLSSVPAPSYLVLDDLHAAEPAAVLLARFVARMRHRLPILIVVTVRETPAADRARRVVELLEPESTRIRLGQLSAADTGALLAAHGVVGVDPALVAVVHQMTAGNPLYLNRFLALAAVDRTAGLPEAVWDVVADSVRRVHPESLAVLAVAAVLGPVSAVTETAAMAGVGAGRVLEAVDEASALGLIARTGVDSFEFGHELVREAVAGTLTAAERLDVHARAAQRERVLALPDRASIDTVPLTIDREQDKWVLGFRGRRVVVGDLAGMRYLARLIARPGTSIPALELAGAPARVPEPSRQAVLDDQARAAYATRARELAAEVAEARAHTDVARAERLESEIEALTRELEDATGLAGRPRHFVVPAERARTSVRKAIKRALDAIAAADAGLAAQLRAAVTTGYHCSYNPAGTGPAAGGLQVANRQS